MMLSGNSMIFARIKSELQLWRVFLDEKNGEIYKCSNAAKQIAYSFIFILMSIQTRFEMMTRIINENKGKLNLHSLENMFGSRLTSKMIRKYQFTNNKFLRRYAVVERRYEKNTNSISDSQWLENQRKLIWFSIIFCNHLRKNYEQLEITEWDTLSYLFFNKNILLLKFQSKQIQRSSERVHWSRKEQALLLDSIKEGKKGRWNDISRRIFFETSGRYYKTSKQCREHWFNHLDSSKKKGQWTKNEDLLLLETVRSEGRKWSVITGLLKGRRTEHMVKNRFNSLVNNIRRYNQIEPSEDTIIDNLIAKMQEDHQVQGQPVNDYSNNGPNIHSNNIESQNSGSQPVNPIQEPDISPQQNQQNNQRQISQPSDLEIRQDQSRGQQLQNGTQQPSWGSGTVTSPYFFVYTPVSFSSTPSPYLQSYQSWMSLSNPALQTLFINPCTPNTENIHYSSSDYVKLEDE